MNIAEVFLYALWFLIATFFAFYIPGRIAIGSLGKTLGERVVLSLLVGLVLWAYQGLVFGYLGFRFLSYFYLLIFFLLWVRQQRARLISFPGIPKKISYPLLGIFLLGIFGQIQQFVITGVKFSDGIRIFTAASDDAFWHAALVAQIANHFPPPEPGIASVVVKNYHYLSNLVIADVVRVFHLPQFPTQFIYMYILVAFLLGVLAFILAKTLRFPPIAAMLLVYMQYFASDVIYLLTFVSRRVFEFTAHPIEDGTMFLENPPRAFASIIALGGVIFLIHWLRDKRQRAGYIAAFLFGSIIGFKIHTGILVLNGLIGLSIYFLVAKKWKMLAIPFVAAMFSALIYLPVNKSAGALLFSPFEVAHEFIVQGKFATSHFELARRIYHDHGNILQEYRMNFIMLAIFFLAQFGIRNAGFILMKKTFRQLGKELSIFLYSAIMITLFIGTFFLQPIATGDTFNFYLAVSSVLSIPAAFTISQLLIKSPRPIAFLLVGLILLFTIPRWIYKTSSVRVYLQHTSPAIYAEELETMEYIKNHTREDEIVLVQNAGQWDSMFPYVSIFTERPMFLSGQSILVRHGIAYQKEEDIARKVFTSDDGEEVQKLLEEHSISILYFYGKPDLAKGLEKIPLEKVFENNFNTVYRFQRN